MIYGLRFVVQGWGFNVDGLRLGCRVGVYGSGFMVLCFNKTTISQHTKFPTHMLTCSSLTSTPYPLGVLSPLKNVLE